jgi:hypothetical protein
MNRPVRAVAALALFLAAACNGSSAPARVSVTLFQAAPDTVEAGQSTTLFFAIDPTDAQVTIAEIGDVTGKNQAVVTPTATTTYHLTASKGKATADSTVTVTVGAKKAIALRLTPTPNTPGAGQQFSLVVAAIDASGATAGGYRGTVHLTSSDPAAVLPADFTFAAADNGVKQVNVTLTTAGVQLIDGFDTASAGIRGRGSANVQAGPGTSCVTAQASSSSVAGATTGILVVVRDAFGNVATGYGGTMQLTSSDARAVLPANTAFVPGVDAGVHAFAVTLITTGSQTLTATDVATAALNCSTSITVSPAAPRVVLSVPPDANAGYPVTVGVRMKDVFDNAIPNYAGTVSFTSSDTGAGAVAPAAVTFTGTEGGVGSTSATFVSLGSQTLAASDGGTPAAVGSSSTVVHGLLYTPATAGRVRLVANAAQSSTQVVQLDLVATERLEISSFFGGGPGSSAVGMNLPLDTTRAGADVTLFTPGAALPAGTGTRAAAGRIGPDHVLYTVVARKRVAGTVFSQVTEVQPGQVFYSVRLKLQPTATPGPVFDGAQPSPLYRASIRDQYGNDFVDQAGIGIGKLEVR